MFAITLIRTTGLDGCFQEIMSAHCFMKRNSVSSLPKLNTVLVTCRFNNNHDKASKLFISKVQTDRPGGKQTYREKKSKIASQYFVDKQLNDRMIIRQIKIMFCRQ